VSEKCQPYAWDILINNASALWWHTISETPTKVGKYVYKLFYLSSETVLLIK
jgi:hypothetical protein